MHKGQNNKWHVTIILCANISISYIDVVYIVDAVTDVNSNKKQH